jgi:hypothetical protein
VGGIFAPYLLEEPVIDARNFDGFGNVDVGGGPACLTPPHDAEIGRLGFHYREFPADVLPYRQLARWSCGSIAVAVLAVVNVGNDGEVADIEGHGMGWPCGRTRGYASFSGAWQGVIEVNPLQIG